jgi:hypothetical protein
MVQTPRRTGFSGPTLIRLLSRLTDVDVPESRQSLSDRLSQWLGWTDAIALSTALNGNPPIVTPDAEVRGDDEQRECARVRTALVKAITEERAPVSNRQREPMRAPVQAPAPAPAPEEIKYSTYRQRYVAKQQTMETAIGNLRSRLRATLAARTAAMTRLAMVDAVLERALSAREYSLLAGVPALLEGHFNRLRQAEQAALAQAQDSGEPAAVTPGAWLDVFRKDMRSVLLAELDVRLQPVEGLLAALHAS